MTSCLICGCIKDSEKYLENVFINIEKIQKLFDKTKIIISYDISKDNTLNKLYELQKRFDIDIIIGNDPIRPIRTVNIERARNKLISKIYTEYNDYDYFIMMDMDDVCSKPINIEVLKEALDKNNVWDGLFFNNANYYDFWALNFKDFQYSCWNCNNPTKLINIMNQEFIKESKNKEFIKCESAFGGFGIYKVNCFTNCFYRTLVDLSLFNRDNLKNIYDNYNILYDIRNNIFDCEHRFFHLHAIRINNVKLFIYNKNLFPEYIGEHTDILYK